MPRSKPKIILEWIDYDTGKCEQILEGENIFVIYYEDNPINIKCFNRFFDYPGPRYKRTAFTSPAHAYNLVKKLNGLFNTDKFNVKIF